MRSDSPRHDRAQPPRAEEIARWIAQNAPTPTIRFRLKAWREYQRALDPLASPKPLPPRRHGGD